MNRKPIGTIKKLLCQWKLLSVETVDINIRPSLFQFEGTSYMSLVDGDDAILLLEQGSIPRKKRTCSSFITPFIVILLVSYGAVIYFYAIIANRWLGNVVAMFFFSFGMLLLLTLTLLSFYRVIFTDAGSPPSPDYWLGLPYYAGREVEGDGTQPDEDRRVLHNRVR